MNERQLMMLDKTNTYASKQGGTCLSTQYDTGETPLKWKCHQGHVWEESWRKTYTGYWCKECLAIHNLKELQLVVEIMYGGKCLSHTFLNWYTSLDFQCAEGHVFSNQPTNILHRGQWCSICITRNKVEKHIKSFMDKTGMKWLTPRYSDANTLMKWQCPEGHIREQTWVQIRAGSTCPDCRKANQLLPLQKVAAEHGGLCLSTTYTKATDDLQWQCREGHVWECSWKKIKGGKWCPTCE